MNDAQPNLLNKLFPWFNRAKREPDESKPVYTVKYRVDSADSMNVYIYEDGKKLYDGGYLLWSNLTWARMWTPWFIRKAKRSRKRDEKIAQRNQRVDMDVKYHHSNRFDPYGDRGDW